MTSNPPLFQVRLPNGAWFDLDPRRRRLTHIPLANTKAVSSLKNVEMDGARS